MSVHDKIISDSCTPIIGLLSGDLRLVPVTENRTTDNPPTTVTGKFRLRVTVSREMDVLSHLSHPPWTRIHAILEQSMSRRGQQ